jgi:hypothetical protein
MMKKQLLVAVCGLSLLLSFGACKKKEEKPPVPQASVPGHPGAGQGQITMPKGQTTVLVPDMVKGKWKAVVLIIEDKESRKKKEYTVDLNSDFNVPGSSLKLGVGDFLPDFKMDGLSITSMSNNPVNPAVRVQIFEGDKEIFNSWFYSKFPAIHPFEHPKYALTLKEGVKK